MFAVGRLVGSVLVGNRPRRWNTILQLCRQVYERSEGCIGSGKLHSWPLLMQAETAIVSTMSNIMIVVVL